jgi:predicted nucleic acid-binding protein
MRRFVDTNIVVYNYAKTEPDKYRKASDAFLGVGRVCSTQVLSELSNVLSSNKFRFTWPEIDTIADEVVSAVDVLTVSIATIKKARALSERYHYSYYDSLILASVIEADCSILYSEDFQHNQIIEGVRIINPFL